VTETREGTAHRFLPALRRQAIGVFSPGGLGRASLLLLSSSAAARAVGFFAALIGAAALGPRQFGEFAFAATTASLISVAGILGFVPLTTKQVANAKTGKEARDVGRLVVTITFLLLTLLGVGYWLALANLSPWIPPNLQTSRVAAGMVSIWAISGGLVQIIGAVLTGHKKFVALANLTLLRGVVVSVSTATAAYITHSAVSTTMAAALSEALACAIAVIFTSMSGWLHGSTRAGWRHNGWPLIHGTLAGVANLLIMAAIWGSMALLLSTPAGHEQNGGFSLANRLTLAITFLPSTLATASLPFISGDLAVKSRSQRVRRIVLFSSGWAIASATILAVSSPLLLSLIGASYTQFTSTVVIMSGAGIAISMNAVLGYLAIADGRIRLWIISDLVLAAILMSVAWATVNRWGAEGLATAYLVSYFVSAAMLIPARSGRQPLAASVDVSRNDG